MNRAAPSSHLTHALNRLPVLLSLLLGAPSLAWAESEADACRGLAATLSRTAEAASRLKNCAREHESRNERMDCVRRVHESFRAAVYDVRCEDDCEDSPETDRRACYIINANVFRGRLEGLGVTPSRIDGLRTEAAGGDRVPDTEDEWRDYLESLRETLEREQAIANLGTAAPSAPAAACSAYERLTALARGPGCTRNRRTVHLTFDDGPKEDLRIESGETVATTSRVLDILQREGIPATFFVLGERLDPANPSNSDTQLTDRFRLIRRMQSEGHQIASHSYSHTPHTDETAETVRSNARRARNAGVGHIVDGRPVTPYLAGVYRLPYGDGATGTSVRPEIASRFRAAGFSRHLYWDIDTNDWRRTHRTTDEQLKTQPPHENRLLNEMMTQACRTGGGTVLFHDVHASTARILPSVITAFRCAGFSFGDLSSVLGGSVPSLLSESQTTPSAAVTDSSAARTTEPSSHEPSRSSRPRGSAVQEAR